MEVFTSEELAFLEEAGSGDAPRLARIATRGPGGMPHVTPVGWRLDPDRHVIEVGGIRLARTKKFRDIERTGVAALVIDDVLPPWRPRGIEVRGEAHAIDGPDPVIRIVPTRIVSWGLADDHGIGSLTSRSLAIPPDDRRSPPGSRPVSVR